ncbi:MAG TPA: hypothetical protein PKE47_11675 [Verrucomicrobiota bacterium]|nr:hypothetical protein [Verrucomicrobiota bacterium]
MPGCAEERQERLGHYQSQESTQALQRHLHEAKRAALREAGLPFE